VLDALDGLLEISVMAIGVEVEVGLLVDEDEGWYRAIEGVEVLNGPQPVVAGDLWPVFRNRIGRITRFKPTTPGGFRDLREGAAPLCIAIADLLVTRKERQRFEVAYGLGGSVPAAIQPASPDIAPEPAFAHNQDYSQVVVSGQIFALGILQARVVRMLHEASRTQDSWRHGKELLTDAGAQTLRMRELFKSKPNWRALIISDGQGRYRLNLPEQVVMRPSHRAYRRLHWAATGGSAGAAARQFGV
jgi:hypothetical protein